jgi:3-hydroxyacyl-CoA dehydrogenase
LDIIRENYETTVRKEKLSDAELAQRMSLLTPSLSIDDLADVDLVIEAVFESIDVKREVFRRLDAVVKPGAILATNTSYLDLDEIAAFTRRPEQVVGMHFFSPANVMRLLEVVRGAKTDPLVVATTMKLGKAIGKVGVVVGNGFGFVGNRMLAQRHREAERLLLEGALPWHVDRVLYEFGFPMGPFAMRDLVGNDVGWDKSKSSSSTIREILNEHGRFGQKVRAGHYDHDENGKPGHRRRSSY